MPEVARLEAPSGSVCEVDDESAALIASLVGDGFRRLDAASVESTPEGEGSTEPAAPKANGSKVEWSAYADSLGVEYPEDAKRDEIRAAVEAHTAEATAAEGETPEDEDTETVEGGPEQGEPTGSGSGIW